jgi:hypothetical protein
LCRSRPPATSDGRLRHAEPNETIRRIDFNIIVPHAAFVQILMQNIELTGPGRAIYSVRAGLVYDRRR